MSKKLHTAENKLKPGSSENLSVAAFGDQAGAKFDRMRHIVFKWLNARDAAELGRKSPEYSKKVAADLKSLASESSQFLADAILNNRPDDLRKLADVIERTHQSKREDKFGNISFPGVSDDVYQVEVYRFLTLRFHPSHRFTFKEIKSRVADAQGIRKIDRDPNEALDRRVRRIAKKIGLTLFSDNKS